ncbi:MAG: hypothetical protein A2770_04700 [Candidatus Levybacteria bacterium RIFCSPHIGHO2_01_FULL_38_12]|nr:MAG: hypothetical protein A2770_04700 [Candidatus Levybacteria bacterium RIFCSPHIGHO2_01_FULL_38_12]
MVESSIKFRAENILSELSQRYPGTTVYDLDGRGMHFLSEVEPVSEHPEYDRAVEVIFDSKPHKHLKMTQNYTILSGTMKLYVDKNVLDLSKGDKYTGLTVLKAVGLKYTQLRAGLKKIIS